VTPVALTTFGTPKKAGQLGILANSRSTTLDEERVICGAQDVFRATAALRSASGPAQATLRSVAGAQRRIILAKVLSL